MSYLQLGLIIRVWNKDRGEGGGEGRFLLIFLSLSWYGDGGVDLFVCLFIGFGGKCVVKKKQKKTRFSMFMCLGSISLRIRRLVTYIFSVTWDTPVSILLFKCFFFYFLTSFLHKRFVFWLRSLIAPLIPIVFFCFPMWNLMPLIPCLAVLDPPSESSFLSSDFFPGSETSSAHIHLRFIFRPPLFPRFPPDLS